MLSTLDIETKEIRDCHWYYFLLSDLFWILLQKASFIDDVIILQTPPPPQGGDVICGRPLISFFFQREKLKFREKENFSVSCLLEKYLVNLPFCIIANEQPLLRYIYVTFVYIFNLKLIFNLKYKILIYFFFTIFLQAATDCKLWAIERQCFQTIMLRTGLIRQAEHTGMIFFVYIF